MSRSWASHTSAESTRSTAAYVDAGRRDDLVASEASRSIASTSGWARSANCARVRYPLAARVLLLSLIGAGLEVTAGTGTGLPVSEGTGLAVTAGTGPGVAADVGWK